MDVMDKIQELNIELDFGLKNLYILWSAMASGALDMNIITDALYFTHSKLCDLSGKLQALLDEECAE